MSIHNQSQVVSICMWWWWFDVFFQCFPMTSPWSIMSPVSSVLGLVTAFKPIPKQHANVHTLTLVRSFVDTHIWIFTFQIKNILCNMQDVFGHRNTWLCNMNLHWIPIYIYWVWTICILWFRSKVWEERPLFSRPLWYQWEMCAIGEYDKDVSARSDKVISSG